MARHCELVRFYIRLTFSSSWDLAATEVSMQQSTWINTITKSSTIHTKATFNYERSTHLVKMKQLQYVTVRTIKESCGIKICFWSKKIKNLITFFAIFYPLSSRCFPQQEDQHPRRTPSLMLSYPPWSPTFGRLGGHRRAHIRALTRVSRTLTNEASFAAQSWADVNNFKNEMLFNLYSDV